MASIRFSPMIGSAAGSIGGITLRNARGGPVASNRALPTRPATDAQLASQALFQSVYRAWAALSAANRLTWTTAALTTATTNRVGLARPRTARELYFATALPMAYAGVTLPTAFAKPVYSQPYATVRAVAIGAEEIYISMDAYSVPTGQAFSIYGARTFSQAIAGATPRLRHLLSTTTARCYIDLRTAFLAHFGQPAIGERLTFRVDHWQPGSTTKTSWPLTCNVLHRGPIINPNPTLEGTWTGQTPNWWYNPTTYTATRITTNPLQAANSWNLTVGDSAANASENGLWNATLIAGHNYEIRFLLALASGTISVWYLIDATPHYYLLLATPTSPWQGEQTIQLTPTAITGNCLWQIINYAHVPGNFTIDNISIREVL